MALSFEDQIDAIEFPKQTPPATPDRSMAGKFSPDSFAEQVDRTTPGNVGPAPDFMDQVDRSALPPVPFAKVDTSVQSTTGTNPPPVRSMRPQSFPAPAPSRSVMPQEIDQANKQAGAEPRADQYENPETMGQILGDTFWNRPEFKVFPKLSEEAKREAARQFVGSSIPGLPVEQVAGPQISTAQVPATKGEQLIGGGIDSIGNTLNFFTSAKGVLTAAIPALPAWMQRLVAAGFAYTLGKNVKDKAAELGTELGKNPDDRDYEKIGENITDILTETGFSALSGAHAGKPGLAHDIPGLKDALTEHITTEYSPREMREIFQKVQEGTANQHEQDVFRFVSNALVPAKEAFGVARNPTTRITTLRPTIDSKFWQSYLGLSPETLVAFYGSEQPKALLTQGDNYANRQQGPMGETPAQQTEGVPPVPEGGPGGVQGPAGARLLQAPQIETGAVTPTGGTGAPGVPPAVNPQLPSGAPPVPPPQAPITPLKSIDWEKLPAIPANNTPIAIQTADGQIVPGLFGGYWEQSPGQPLPGNKPVVAYLTPSGKWSHGTLHEGDTIIDGEVPPYSEWHPKQPVKLSSDERMDLSVISSLLRQADELKLNVAGVKQAYQTYQKPGVTRSEMAEWPPIRETLKTLNTLIADAKKKQKPGAVPPPGAPMSDEMRERLLGPPADAPREKVISLLQDRLREMAANFSPHVGAHVTGTWFEGGVNYPAPGDAYIKGRGITIYARLKDLQGGAPDFKIAGEETAPQTDDHEILGILNSNVSSQQMAVNLKKLAAQRGISVKQMQEQVELQIVRSSQALAIRPDRGALFKFHQLVEAYNEQPNLSARTSTSIENQAYSTPAPMAFALGHMTGVTPQTALFDDTAGNGMLFIGGNFARSEGNELNAERRENLRKLGIGTVTGENALNYSSPRKFEIVHLNPPFGTIKQPTAVDGYGLKKIEHIIAARGLTSMEDTGTAGIILGAGMEPNAGRENRGALWVFENWLYAHYNVVANFELSGDLYARQGAKWPVQIIVIAGRKTTPIPIGQSGDLGPKSVARYDTWEQLWDEAQKTRDAVTAYRDSLGTGGTAGVPNLLPPGSRPPAVGGGAPGAPSGDVTTTEEGGVGEGAGAGQSPTGQRPPAGGAQLPSGETTGGSKGAGLPAKQPGGGGGTAPPVEGGAKGGGKGAPANAPTGGGAAPGGGKSGELSGKGALDRPAGSDITDLTDADLDNLLDTASEQVKKPTKPKQPRPAGKKQGKSGTKSTKGATKAPVSETLEGTPPPAGGAPGATTKAAADIISDLAKQGITGIDKAVQGLTDLFGGSNLGGVFGVPPFNEKTYAEAKKHFQEAWEQFKKAGKSLLDFAKYWIQKVGDVIKPYLKRFMQDVQQEQAEEKLPPKETTSPKQPPKVNATEYQVPYEPRSDGSPFGTLIPKNIAQGVFDALDAIKKAHGSIDEYVADRLHMDVMEIRTILAADQIDGVALGIYQFETGGALVIGDETGIGKGRQAAAFIRYALLNGMIPVFFTKDPKLFSDMWGDLKDIHTIVKPLIFGDPAKASIVDAAGNRLVSAPSSEIQRRIINDILQNGWDPDKFNAIFSTYSQVNVRNARQEFLEQLSRQNPVVIVMDEAHEAAGDAESSMQAAFFSGGPGVKRKNPVTGLTMTIHVPGILNANGAKAGMGGVAYLSATYAKRPENMPVYFRTGLSKAAQNFGQIVEAMKKGGVALQQAVSEALAKAGQYVRRERDFTGVRYDMKMVEVKDLAKLTEEVDAVTDVLSQIVDFSERIRDAVLAEGEGNESTAMSQNATDMTDFAAIVHNQVSQLLLAAKAEEVVAECVAAIKAGEKPVIALMNTMESFLDQFVTDHNIQPVQSITLRWNELTRHALSRTLRAKEKLPGGQTNIIIINPDEYGLGDLYRSIQRAADAIESKFPISPIDYIIQRLKAEGVKIAELTGRESGLEYTNFETGEATYKHFKKANKNTVVNGFNNGTYDGMLLNASGSTGLSAHASEKKEVTDKRPRHMVIAQPALDINVFMQTLGRIRRTGMVLLGRYKTPQGEVPYGARYTHLVLPIQAELRPAAMTARKMKSLNANTTADSDSAIKIDAEDIFNKYGDAIVAEYLDQTPEIQSMLGLFVSQKDDGTLDYDRDLARRFTGRMALLPDSSQKQAYDYILPAYRQRIEQLKATGEYDLEIVVHDDWDGRLQDDQQLKAGTDESNIFTASTRLQIWNIRDLRHVPTGDEMVNEFQRKTGGREKLLQDWDEVKANGDAKLDEMEARINQERAAWQADEDRKAELSEKEVTAHESEGISINVRAGQVEAARRRWSAAKAMADLVMEDAGRVVKLQNNATGDEFQGMLTEVRFPTNRFSPGAFRFKFLLHAPGGVAYINGAQFRGQEGWELGPSNSVPSDLGPGDKNARYERFFVVGNPIQGYVSTGGRGKMVRFKSSEGQVVTGLQMPRNWGPAQLVSDPRLELVNGTAATHFLVTHAKAGADRIPIESGQVVRIVRPSWGDRTFQISTPAAKSTGGTIYLDGPLRDITGDFDKRGNRMVANVSEEDMPAAIDRIVKITGQNFKAIGEATPLIPLVADSNTRGSSGRSRSSIEAPGETATGEAASGVGIEGIRRMFEDPELKISDEARRVALALLSEPVMRNLDWSKLMVSVRDRLPGDVSGRANIANQLIELSKGARPGTFPHEIFHFLWELLPPEVRAEVEQYRQEEIQQALGTVKDATALPPEVQELLGRMMARDGIHSEDFLRAMADIVGAHPELKAFLDRWYYLSSPQEYLAGVAGNEYARSNPFYHKEESLFQRLLARIREWLNGLLEALRRVIGYKPGIKRVISDLLNGRYRNTPEAGAELERWQAEPGPEKTELPEDEGLNMADLELDNEKVTTQRMGVIDTILGREQMSPEMLEAGKRHAEQTFTRAGLQVIPSEDNGYYELVDPDFESEIEGRRLLKLVQDDISTQQQPGQTMAKGALGFLINSIRNNMVGDDVTAFSPALKAELYAVTQGEASHRGLMLGVLAGLRKTAQYVARNVNTILARTYSDAFGGDFIRKILARITDHMRDYFTDEEISKALEEKPALKDLVDKTIALRIHDEGNAAYRWVQRLLKPKFKKTLAKLQSDARTEEAVNSFLEQAARQGIEPKPTPKPTKLTAVDRLIHLMTPATSAKINGIMRAAVEAAEFNAGRKQALLDAQSDEERQELLANFQAGEEPTRDQIERGLDQPEYRHWKDIRDNLVGYDPVTLKTAQDLIREDFSKTRFKAPVQRPADTRIDLEKLAQEPEAEVTRVLDAYWANLEANMDLSRADEGTRARVLSIIETQLAGQLERARERVRAPLFQPPQERGATLTPEARLGAKINAGLFRDPRLDLVEYVQTVANKSIIQRVMPKASDLVRQALDTPFYRQAQIAQNFSQILINRYGVPAEVADRAAALFEAAYQNLFEKARVQAIKRATDGLTPKERKFARPGKPLWHKIVAAANAGIFDSTDVLRQIAAAKGWTPPTEAQVKRFKDLAAQIQKLQELTPEERAQAGNDAEALRRAQAARDALTEERRGTLSKDISALWAKMTRPIVFPGFSVQSWRNAWNSRRNIADAINEFEVANMLLKVGFALRLPTHIISQLFWHIPTRAAGVAWMRQAEGSRESAWRDLNVALADGYGRALKALRPAIASARSALAGRGQSRNVDRLVTGVLMFERMEAEAKAASEKGQHGKAAVLRLLGLARFSLRFVQAVDNFQGVPAEFQELANQIEGELRERGMDKAEIAANKDRILGNLKEKRDAAMALARQVLGENAGPNEVNEAAWNLVRSNIYEDIRALGLPADDFRAKNEKLRRTIAWQERVTHGLGGLVAGAGKMASGFAANIGLPFSFARFANAVGTGINYSLFFTPLYAQGAIKVPGMGGDEESPWFWSEEDRYQRRVQAIVGSILGALIMGMVFAGLIRVFLRGPKNKAERELWEAQGHRSGTIELVLNDHEFIPMSLTVGLASAFAPYAATAGAILEAVMAREKAQEKLNAEAEKKGIAPGKIPPIGALDIASIAAQSLWGTLISGKAFSGVVQSGTEYGVPNVSKMAAAYVSPNILGLPAYQEFARGAGVNMDSKLSGFWDFLVPLPTSQARAVNILGDPVGTPDAVQRWIQTLTAGGGVMGIYPGIVDTEQAKALAPYAALLNSGYRPPAVDSAKGYPIDGEYRPMNKTELADYSVARGQNFKQSLEALGPDATLSDIRTAFNQANQTALQSVGVDTSAMEALSKTAPGNGQVPTGSASRYVTPQNAQVPSIAAGGGAPLRGAARLPNLRRGVRLPARSLRGPRGPSIRRPGGRAGALRRTGAGGIRSLRPRAH